VAVDLHDHLLTGHPLELVSPHVMELHLHNSNFIANTIQADIEGGILGGEGLWLRTRHVHLYMSSQGWRVWVETAPITPSPTKPRPLLQYHADAEDRKF
jgi:hypothetical protein